MIKEVYTVLAYTSSKITVAEDVPSLLERK